MDRDILRLKDFDLETRIVSNDSFVDELMFKGEDRKVAIFRGSNVSKILDGVLGSSWRRVSVKSSSLVKDYLRTYLDVSGRNVGLVMDVVKVDGMEEGLGLKRVQDVGLYLENVALVKKSLDKVRSRIEWFEIRDGFIAGVVGEIGKEVEAGDILKGGIYFRWNGEVRIGLGVHRLVCSNGLVREEVSDFISLDDGVVSRLKEMVDWLTSLRGHKVDDMRKLKFLVEELPAAFRDLLRKWIPLKEKGVLDWYSVVNDITLKAQGFDTGYMWRAISRVGNTVDKMLSVCRCDKCGSEL